MPDRGTLTVAWHELKSFLDRPAGYILLAVFAAVVDFLFFRAAFSTGEASLRPLFTIIPWLWLIFVPAVTMRLIAEEERSGTLEVLLTQPIREIDVLLGKFLGGWAVVSLALATTIPIPLGLATAGRLDWGVVFSQYVAGLLLGGALTAIGLFASSLTKNQVMASILGAVIGFVFMIIGFELVTLTVPRRVAEWFNAVSLLAHTDTIGRGVLDLRDILFFVSVMFVFCLGAYLMIRRKRVNPRSEEWLNLEVGAIFLVGIAVALNMLAAPFGLRADLTASGLFTLSPATVRVIRTSPEPITLTLWASRDLPAQVALTYRDVRDVLRDYAGSSGGKVQLVERFPDIDKSAADAAQSLGVQPVQFNVVKNQQFSVSQGWLGVTLQAGTKKEAVPFVQRTDDLEYQLTSLIRKMSGVARSTVAFSTGHQEKTATDYALVRQELQKTYTVKDVQTGKNGLDLGGVRVLVVAGPQTPFSAKDRASIARFLDAGGKALFLLEGYTINSQFMMATPNPASLSDFVARYGVKVEPELLFDLKSNEQVSFTGGQVTYSIPYPFWPRVKAVAPTVVGNIDTVVLPWPSPVSAPTTGTPKGAQVIPLLKTSDGAGAEGGQPSIAPDRQFDQSKLKLGTLLAGAAVQGPPAKSSWRVVVVGDADFPSDRYVQNAPENGVLMLNSIDWLAQDDLLAGIRAKASQPRQLQFQSGPQELIVVWGIQFGVPLLIAGIGTWHLLRRRRRARRGDAR